MLRFSPSASAAAAFTLVAATAFGQPVSAQASGTMQATVSVLAAARPLNLEMSASKSRPEQVELRVVGPTEYCGIHVDAPWTSPDAPAARPQELVTVRVTVTYLR